MSRLISTFSRFVTTSALLVGLAGLSGCFKTTAIIPNQAPAETHTRWAHGFFWGAVGGWVDTAQMCGGRPVARITTDRSIGNVAVQWITLGIYTPTRVRVTCAQPMGGAMPYGYWSGAPPVYGGGGGYPPGPYGYR